MSDATGFIKWYEERQGHPAQIKTAYNVVTEQQAEIADQKEQITKLTLRNASTSSEMTKLQMAHNKLVDEKLALKAQVELLRDALSGITKEENIHPIKDWAICGICTNSSSGSDGRKTRFKKFDKFFELISDAESTINKTPQQCLASVKADAKADVINHLINTINIGMANAELDGGDILVFLNIELETFGKSANEQTSN